MSGDDLQNSFPAFIRCPPEIRALCDCVRDNGYPISGLFELVPQHEDETIRLWFGSDAAVGKLAHFGCGPDGSLYCFWRCPSGGLPIVHMGSEGQENSVLASTPADFLRLLAIGYDEIGFADLDAIPDIEDGKDGVNPRFKDWVSMKFGVDIPKTGSEIVRSARAAHDDFQDWIESRYD